MSGLTQMALQAVMTGKHRISILTIGNNILLYMSLLQPIHDEHITKHIKTQLQHSHHL